MGVRGLQTFLEQHCPMACYTVKISELAKKYKEETGKDPVIVLDAQSCYSLWCKGVDWVIGFEIQDFLYRLRSFVEAFKRFGIKLVFFFGGVTVEKKRKSWITRRTKNLRDVFAVCDFLSKGNVTSAIPERLASLPPTMGLFTSMLLKYVLNCEVYMSIEECDEEIVEYAYKNECFAIFAQDTDFIVSDIKSVVLSSKNFNISNMTTLIYDRIELAKILRIRVEQLPLLSILAGNDFIDFETIKGFHCMICNTKFEDMIRFEMLMPAIGNYINSLPDLPTEELLRKICQDLFNSERPLHLVETSYCGYLLQHTPRITNPTTKWERILQIARYRHRNTIVPSCIWSILKDQVFELSVAYEDLRRSSDKTSARSFMPSATVTRPMRQRMYGVLLNEYEDLPVKVKEWCGEYTYSYQQPVLVDISEPIVHHPGLLVLWSDNNSNRLSQMKWKLFLSCISSTISNINEWTGLTEDLVGISATIYYLFEQEFFSGYEMNAIMATIATYPLYSRQKLADIYYGPPHPRSTHISVTVLRTFSMVVMLMAACGYPVPISGELIYLKFEAKLFQLKYKEMKQKRTVEEMCENDKKCLETFNQMRRIVSRAIRKSNRKKPQAQTE